MADFHFSVFGQPAGTRAGSDSSLLREALDAALRTVDGAGRWTVRSDDFWYHLTPAGQRQRPQGWKLHVSATIGSAEAVLARSLPVLLRSSSAFKFASTPDHVALLNARHTSRGHSGKFITVYPSGDDEAVRLAEALHQATAGLPGPRILSDRPYAARSLVHYRYGAFVEERKISNDGFYAWVIFDPDGNPVEDRRGASYAPPAWAPCPFPDQGPSGPPAAKGGGHGVMLGGRFLVREAIRHANKGGVYRAVDTSSGAEAVIKEARAHVAADETGRDVRDQLRAEARAVQQAEPFGVTPRVLQVFEQAEHLFLAEELVPGVPLSQWVPDRIREDGWRRRAPEALDMASRVVRLMERTHRAGLIVRDFNPNNIMVRPDGELRLIDLELAVTAAEQGERTGGAGTPSYSAPEQMNGAAAAFTADYYSLGATICFVLTGSAPYFLDDMPESRTVRERLEEWLAVRGEEPGIPGDVRRLILGLMDDEPGSRWTAAAAGNALRAARQPARQPPRAPLAPCAARSNGAGLDDAEWEKAVDGAVDYLRTSMNPADRERLWPASCASGAPDPCCVQHGAAGVLAVLTRCFELTRRTALSGTVAAAGEWIMQRLRAGTTRPPGLYFGEAGVAWSLYECGRALGDDRMTRRAVELAGTLPVSWSNPDVTHGTAGIGLTFLHLWQRTGSAEFAERAGRSADALVAAADDDPGGLSWRTPQEFDSRLAGRRHFGFAHGTAGIGYFLLAAGAATGRDDCLALARRAGETLLASATTMADGVALWGVGPGDAMTAPYWCHGSSGIGSFLTRLHAVTGDDRFGKLAEMSAHAVTENSWRGVLGQCHGLAGNGEFLLDMADGPGGERYRAMAGQHARLIFASRAYRDGMVVFPDEQGDVSASWGDGMSGILDFLLRLRYRAPRPWMVSPLPEGAGLP